MPDTALCSIIMPCYGMGKYVNAALESIIAQTCPTWELIVVDDCGPDDGTRASVEDFASRHPSHRVAYLRHDENRGVSGARKTAVRESRGKYLVFLDPDDQLSPNKLTEHVHILEQHSNVVLVHSAITAFDCSDADKMRVERGFALSDKAKVYSLRDEPHHFLGNGINNSTVVCRRSAVNEQDFPDKLFFQAEDWYVWLRLSARGAFYFDPRPLTRYRWHPQSFSARVYEQPGAAALAFLEVLATLYSDPGATDRPALAAAMVAQLNRLITERGLVADPPVANAGKGLWRSLAKGWIRLGINRAGKILRLRG